MIFPELLILKSAYSWLNLGITKIEKERERSNIGIPKKKFIIPTTLYLVIILFY